MRTGWKTRIKGLVLSLAVCIIVGGAFYVSNFYSSAATTGVVSMQSSNTLNVRSGPGTNYGKIGSLNNGQSVNILQDMGNGWYKIEYGSGEGYVIASSIALTAVDDGYKQQLLDAGFPESYCNALASLHSQYPNWQFVPQQTGMDWNSVVAAHCAIGKNNVENSSISSWKSIEPGAYDLSSGQWVGQDGARWVAASDGIIRYYMDPRNFLDSKYIFLFLLQSFNEGAQNTDGVNRIISGTFMANGFSENSQNYSYADVLMEAGRQSGVSPYALASAILTEQGNGTSQLISGTYPGYEGLYNYLNIGAYDDGNRDAVQRGLWYARGFDNGDTSYNRPWNSRYKSIIGGAQFYGSQYVARGQDTTYLKKFNVQGASPHTHQYMTSIYGAANESAKLSNAYDQLKDMALVFKIPVYSNMPNTVCAKPTGDGNPVNLLSNIEVSGYGLSPSFNIYTTQYSLVVDDPVAAVNISASTYDSSARILSGTGSVALKEGMNTVQITVQAQNGTTRTYTLNIAKSGGGTAENPGGENPPAGNVTKGDVNQDGSIDVLDLVRVQKAIIGLTTLNADQFAAADVNGDGTVDIIDLIRIQKHILGIQSLS